MIKVTRIGHATFETPDVERQVDYFTDIVGLVPAEKANGRAYLATRVGDLVVQLEKGSEARCARISFPRRRAMMSTFPPGGKPCMNLIG